MLMLVGEAEAESNISSEFPLHNLDLKSFVFESNKQHLAGTTTYDLYGVINHYGEFR